MSDLISGIDPILSLGFGGSTDSVDNTNVDDTDWTGISPQLSDGIGFQSSYDSTGGGQNGNSIGFEATNDTGGNDINFRQNNDQTGGDQNGNSIGFKSVDNSATNSNGNSASNSGGFDFGSFLKNLTGTTNAIAGAANTITANEQTVAKDIATSSQIARGVGRSIQTARTAFTPSTYTGTNKLLIVGAGIVAILLIVELSKE